MRSATQARQSLSMTKGEMSTDLVGLGVELVLSLTVGPVVPKDTAHRVWQHHLDAGVHVLQEAAGATDSPSSAASSYKMSHPRLGLHPDLHPQVDRSLLNLFRRHDCCYTFTGCETDVDVRRQDDSRVSDVLLHHKAPDNTMT